MNNLQSRIIDLLLTVLYSFSIVFSLIKSAHLQFNGIQVFLLVLFCIILFKLIFDYKYFRIFVFIISISIFAYLIYRIYKNPLFAKLLAQNYLEWLKTVIQGDFTKDLLFQLVSLLFVTILISLISFYYTNRHFNFINIALFGISIFTAQAFNSYLNSNLSFYLMIFLLILYYLRNVYFSNISIEKNRYLSISKFTILSLPFAAIIMLISIIHPIYNKKIEFKIINNIIEFGQEYYKRTFIYNENGIFTLSKTGFNSTGELGGKVFLDNTPVLEITTSQIQYFKGIVKNDYDGKKWLISTDKITTESISPSNLKNNGIEYPIKRYIDVSTDFFELGILSTAQFKDKFTYNEFYRDNIKEIESKVKFLKISTNSLFTPINSTNLYLKNKKINTLLIDGNDCISTNKVNKTNFEYTIKTQKALLSEDLLKIYNASEIGYYNKLVNKFNLNSDNAPKDQQSNGILTYQSIANKFTQDYTKLPKELPIRVKEFTDELLKDKKTTYTKAKAIETYFTNNYFYSLDTPKPPKDRDFVDFVLFDLKKGYCSYFATAMTIMLRTQGIPARYVEGYVFPGRNPNGNVYKITNQNAHAWVEVYLEGVGWVNFEPTPSFNQALYNNYNNRPNFDDEFLNNPANRDYLQNMINNDNLKLKLPDVPTATNVTAKKGFSNLKLLIVVVFLILLSFISFITYLYYVKKKNFELLSKFDNRKSVIKLYKYYLDIFSKLGYTVQYGETSLQFSNRIEGIILFHNSFIEISNIFVNTRYSLNEITDKDKETLVSFREKLRKVFIKEYGRIKTFIILLKIK